MLPDFDSCSAEPCGACCARAGPVRISMVAKMAKTDLRAELSAKSRIVNLLSSDPILEPGLSSRVGNSRGALSLPLAVAAPLGAVRAADLDLAGLGGLRLGERERENAVLVRGLRLGGIDRRGQAH